MTSSQTPTSMISVPPKSRPRNVWMSSRVVKQRRVLERETDRREQREREAEIDGEAADARRGFDVHAALVV